jgi:hypothetical protein
MNRAELEHVIRAASGIVGDPDIVVIGSQAVLAQFPAAPAPLLASMEVDVSLTSLTFSVNDGRQPPLTLGCNLHVLRTG